MALPWERIIGNSASLSAAKLPDYGLRAAPSPQSRRLWSARLERDAPLREAALSGRLYLPRGKSQRGWRGRHGSNAIVRIPGWAPPLIST